jgi:hypothetical protein
MYVAVRRYEGVSDPQKVAQLAREGFLPIIRESPASWPTTWSTPATG